MKISQQLNEILLKCERNFPENRLKFSQKLPEILLKIGGYTVHLYSDTNISIYRMQFSDISYISIYIGAIPICKNIAVVQTIDLYLRRDKMLINNSFVIKKKK